MLELNDNEGLNLFMRVRASQDPAVEVFYHWSGSIYAMISGRKYPKLFDFEGFNVARIMPAPSELASSSVSHVMLSREASFYKDVSTGEIIERWKLPPELRDARNSKEDDNKDMDVIHVWNDPVNSALGKMKLPTDDLGDTIAVYFNIMLAYPNPLTVEEFPKHSQSNLYQAAEMFTNFVSKKDVDDKSLSSLPCHISWTRLGHWLPWMEMGQTPGNLVYQTRGHKLMNGWADMPKHIKDYVEMKNPKYKHAPSEYSKHNATTWTCMKQTLLAKKEERVVQPVGRN